jgi:heavy metal translocating P-type ATPase
MTRGPRETTHRFRVVHELTTRLRIKSNGLRDPALDIPYLTALMEAQPGVLEVRINQRAACIVVRHRGEARIKADILHLLNNLPVDAFIPDAQPCTAPDMPEVLARGALAAFTPFMPTPAKVILSWGLALPSIVNGVECLFDQGFKVEVLDGSVKIFALLRGDYFAANTIGAMLALAEHVEHATQRRTNDLLKGLLRPQVESVRVRRDGVDVHIPFEDTRVGDHVLCGHGELVAVDGIVLQGEASVNASSMTGESVPAHLKPGDVILSGSVVEEGSLVVEASSVGADTSSARIAGYIERSLRQTSDRQRRSDRLADRLVPLTFGLGLGIFALTGNLARAASVLTVDYSCAVKLSTPVAVRAAMYAAGREGILLKGAQALEALAKVDTVVFDKTGTLTQGALQVTDVLPLSPPPEALEEDALLSLAAGAEEHYSHPVAAAVVAAARSRGLKSPEMSQVDFVVAHGVSAYIQGARVLVGSRHFVHDDEDVNCSPADGPAQEFHSQGKSLLYVAREGRLLGVIAMRDTVRPEAARTLLRLRECGVTKLVMLTGDQWRAAEALREHLPELDEVHAECKPEHKAAILEELAAQGRHVAFVGDGVNDAPALVAADVGVSMPSGADLARDVAQVILLKDDLEGLVRTKLLALRTERILRRCLWSSVSLNTVLLGLAGGGYIPVVVSAAVHNSGTIGVLAYAAMQGSAALPSNTVSEKGTNNASAALPGAL